MYDELSWRWECQSCQIVSPLAQCACPRCGESNPACEGKKTKFLKTIQIPGTATFSMWKCSACNMANVDPKLPRCQFCRTIRPTFKECSFFTSDLTDLGTASSVVKMNRYTQTDETGEIPLKIKPPLPEAPLDQSGGGDGDRNKVSEPRNNKPEDVPTPESPETVPAVVPPQTQKNIFGFKWPPPLNPLPVQPNSNNLNGIIQGNSQNPVPPTVQSSPQPEKNSTELATTEGSANQGAIFPSQATLVTPANPENQAQHPPGNSTANPQNGQDASKKPLTSEPAVIATSPAVGTQNATGGSNQNPLFSFPPVANPQLQTGAITPSERVDENNQNLNDRDENLVDMEEGEEPVSTNQPSPPTPYASQPFNSNQPFTPFTSQPTNQISTPFASQLFNTNQVSTPFASQSTNQPSTPFAPQSFWPPPKTPVNTNPFNGFATPQPMNQASPFPVTNPTAFSIPTSFPFSTMNRQATGIFGSPNQVANPVFPSPNTFSATNRPSSTPGAFTFRNPLANPASPSPFTLSLTIKPPGPSTFQNPLTNSVSTTTSAFMFPPTNRPVLPQFTFPTFVATPTVPAFSAPHMRGRPIVEARRRLKNKKR